MDEDFEDEYTKIKKATRLVFYLTLAAIAGGCCCLAFVAYKVFEYLDILVGSL